MKRILAILMFALILVSTSIASADFVVLNTDHFKGYEGIDGDDFYTYFGPEASALIVLEVASFTKQVDKTFLLDEQSSVPAYFGSFNAQNAVIMFMKSSIDSNYHMALLDFDEYLLYYDPEFTCNAAIAVSMIARLCDIDKWSTLESKTFKELRDEIKLCQ